MSGQRATRKVTIDTTGRHLSTGDVGETSKKKSVFERLGGSTSKSLVKSRAVKKITTNGESSDDNPGKHKGFVGYAAKKSDDIEKDASTKKKQLESVDDTMRPKKKKKQKEEKSVGVKTKRKNEGKEEGEITSFIVKKKKKLITSPSGDGPAKKKRKLVVNEAIETFPLKKSSSSVEKKKTFVKYHSGSGAEDVEKKKKKSKLTKPTSKDGSSKKGMKIDLISPKKKKTKVKAKSTDGENTENSEGEGHYFNQHSPEWSLSEDDDNEPIVFKKKKKFRKGEVKKKQRVSLSPYKDLSSFESGISSESEHELPKTHKNRKQRGRQRGDFMPRQQQHFYDQCNSSNDFNRGDRDNFSNSSSRDFNRMPQERRQNNTDHRHQFDFAERRRDDYCQGNPNKHYDHFNERFDSTSFSGSSKRGMEYDETWRDDERRHDMRYDMRTPANRYGDDFRDGNRRDYYRENNRDFRNTPIHHGNEWHHDNNMFESDNRFNRGGNYQPQRNRGGRGGRMGGGYRGGYNNQYNEVGGRYQRGAPMDRDYMNEPPDDYAQDRFPRYDYHGDDRRSKEPKFEMSPIRVENFIGAIKKSDSEDEEVSKTKKKKHLAKRKKENESESDVTDTETKKAKKGKTVKKKSAIKEAESAAESAVAAKASAKLEDGGGKANTKSTKVKTEKRSVEKSVKEKKNPQKKVVKEEAKSKEAEKTAVDSSAEKKKKKVEKKKVEKKRERSVESDGKRQRSEKTKTQDSDERKTKDNRSKLHSRSPTGSFQSEGRRNRSPDSKDSAAYKRGQETRRRSPIRIRDSSYNKKEGVRNRNQEGSREWEKRPATRVTTPLLSENKKTLHGADSSTHVYESISDEELELFDDNDVELKAPQPASVMEVDWSLLKPCKKNTKESSSDVPDYLRQLSPGNVLAEIGYSPTLLQSDTLVRVQNICLAAKNIPVSSLDTSEEINLQTGMASTVCKVLANRSALSGLFAKNIVGLRNDLALRRELRRPIDKIGTNGNLFCSPPSLLLDYKLFSNSVEVYDKKQQNDKYPLYVTVPSKVGSVVMCKS